MKLREVIAKGMSALEAHGRPDAAIDSKLLMLHLLEKDTNWMLMHYGDEVEEAVYDHYMRLVEERASGVPLQHITHSQEFMGLPFYVDHRVLIPRQDTETLVETILEYGQQINFQSGVEIGMGSGCISISLAHYMPKLHMLGIDISSDALEVARHNILNNQVSDRVHVLESDVFENYQKPAQSLDLIVSNPPYISTEECKQLMTEVIQYEPTMALTDGGDGLRFYREITQAAKHYLKDGGLLAYEIGYDQGLAVCQLLEEAQFKQVRLIQDLAGKDRVVVGIK